MQDLPRTKTLEHLGMRDNMFCWISQDTLYVRSSYYNKSYEQFIGNVNTMSLLNDSIVCLNTVQGTKFFNVLQQKMLQQFLPLGNVSDCLVDREGGYWFSTLNDGVYRLGSPGLNSITARTAAGQKLGVYSLQKFNDELWAGCDLGHLLKIRNNTATAIALSAEGKGLGSNLVYAVRANDNTLAAASGNYIFVKQKDDRFTAHLGIGANKDLAWKNNNELVVGLFGVSLFNAAQWCSEKTRFIKWYARPACITVTTRHGSAHSKAST